MSEMLRKVPEEYFPVPTETAIQLQQNTEQLGAYLVQMAQLMAAMQRRMDEMEENQRRATASHEEVKGIGVLIRLRAREYCEKYSLADPKDEAKIRGAIKRTILQRYGIRDLHDCPQVALRAVEAQINRWVDIRLVQKIRDAHREGYA